MPRSKRNKQVELAKTKKRGLEWKKGLFEEVRSCVDKYENVFVFSVNDMRNNKMKNVREQWKHSRFFIGKNKIMAMALGRCAEEEYRPNLHKLGQQIKGQRALLFSNKPVEEVLSWFRSYSEGDYARSGNTATETVQLPAGPLTMFPHNLEPYLRELGLPTTLEKGVIHLIKDHEVCKTGDVLTPETAKILKFLGYEMAEFHITIDCVWSKDGTFMQLSENIDTDAKENKKQKKKSSLSSFITEKNDVAENEQMEIEQDDEESSDDNNENEDENKNEEKSKEAQSDSRSDIVESPLKSTISTTSTPKVKSNDVKENGVSSLNEECNKSSLKCNVEEIPEKNGEILEKNNDECNMQDTSEKTDDECNMQETTEKTNEESNMQKTSEKSNDKASAMSERKTPATKRGRPRVSAKTPKISKKESSSKRESLIKTPDPNTSQDSPVFRELRTRSVKFSRKRK